MPPETTKAEFQEMLRNLIKERFGLQYHAGKKEITGYALTIARSGPKLKKSADQGEAKWGLLDRRLAAARTVFRYHLQRPGNG